MYDYFIGKVTYLDEFRLTLECHSVGYIVFLASSSLSQILSTDVRANQKDSLLRIYTYHYYSESDKEKYLYGFTFRIERELFRLLISVAGVGPRLAARMMLFFSSQTLLRYLMIGDSVPLKKVKGLGEKTAEKMVIELKGKAKDLFHSPLTKDWTDVDQKDLLAHGKIYEDAREAMLALGYRQKEIDFVLKEIAAGRQDLDNVEDVLKIALVRIAK